MKKLFITILGCGLIIGAGLLIMQLFSNEVTDRFNPLVPKKEIYVQVNKEGTALSPGGYNYTLTGFDKDGRKKEVTFYASGELRKDAYLRIFTKGKYIETWEEVQQQDIPEQAKQKL
ncbi:MULTISPECIES: YxeA family protein [Virgibacillus]|uniref:YxeA family protein n=2 Tax=Virgibacillus TaxID=84406 RepID=A0A024Q6E0_9BACI|nr:MULTISPECIES: YxeA family protein [Virgibacillus]EQB38397.1 hypothetical protein M948_07395 [Virgibacillus sp. CM-4]MYL41103.1 YxeA family protein [Virgibacillus massiliensis]GGJ54296.1 hypothetical protein GCM10007111_15650 [Virgibacillus kapii]CDQ38093.1 hypothetical protein BN990_00360 [Virgibacillus massiliensis]